MVNPRYDVPVLESMDLLAIPVSGVVNQGDFLVFSGNYAVPTALAAANVAQVRASGLGIATDNSIRWDRFGNLYTADTVEVRTNGVFRVSANFSGRPPIGTPVYPATTGSGVGYPTGLTGVGAKWGTAVQVAAGLGTASGLGVLLGWFSAGNGGTGEMLIGINLPSMNYI